MEDEKGTLTVFSRKQRNLTISHTLDISPSFAEDLEPSANNLDNKMR